ncbi:toll/interleukin-1 receptor domain-containing protein [Thermococcus sp.]|uniref:toll/interleukin-1 receptor domain-containing protein n=1 Tax=Thermococcus sp. TaxID=35749 RepID=UPI0026236894|nr:toll/interleukin-1 receptor domain-containing protein [Thermococcus sp.]
MKRRFDIFISYYARTGLEYAEELKKALEEHGWKGRVFMADHNIKPGENWEHVIFKEALPQIKYFIFLYTQGAESRKWVIREYHHALKTGKIIIPCIQLFPGEKIGDVLRKIEGVFPGISSIDGIGWKVDNRAELNSKVLKALKRYEEGNEDTLQSFVEGDELSNESSWEWEKPRRASKTFPSNDKLHMLVELAITSAKAGDKINLHKHLCSFQNTLQDKGLDSIIKTLEIYIQDDLPLSEEFVQMLEITLNRILTLSERGD